MIPVSLDVSANSLYPRPLLGIIVNSTKSREMGGVETADMSLFLCLEVSHAPPVTVVIIVCVRVLTQNHASLVKYPVNFHSLLVTSLMRLCTSYSTEHNLRTLNSQTSVIYNTVYFSLKRNVQVT